MSFILGFLVGNFWGAPILAWLTSLITGVVTPPV